MTKTHFARIDGTAYCGTVTSKRNISADAFRVTCGNCKNREGWPVIAAKAIEARREAIEAQPAREVINPWNGKVISCRNCGGHQFKDAGRSLDSNNHKCADCGTMNHTMTETGMSA